MSIEIGARLGLVAPDGATFAYVRGREFAPTGDAGSGRCRLAQAHDRSGTPFDRDFVDRLSRSRPASYLGRHQQDVAGIDQNRARSLVLLRPRSGSLPPLRLATWDWCPVLRWKASPSTLPS